MLSSCNGAIKKFAFVRTGEAVTNPEVLLHTMYADLIRTLPEQCELLWIGHFPDLPDEYCLSFSGRTIRFIQYNGGSEKGPGFSSRWIQDPFICSSDNGVYTITLSKTCDAESRLIAETLSRAVSGVIRESPLPFEGGNLLNNGKTLFAGKDLLNKLVVRGQKVTFRMIADAEAKLKELSGLNHIEWIGGEKATGKAGRNYGQTQDSFQPFYHIDLYLTPAGLNHKQQEQLLIAEPVFLNPQEVKQYDIALFNEVYSMLWKQEQSLQEKGYDTIRIPLPIHRMQDSWRILSYNNCWMECISHQRTAYLPDYRAGSFIPKSFHDAIAGVQEKISNILSAQQIIPRWISLNINPRHAGSFHCMTQVLERN